MPAVRSLSTGSGLISARLERRESEPNMIISPVAGRFGAQAWPPRRRQSGGSYRHLDRSTTRSYGRYRNEGNQDVVGAQHWTASLPCGSTVKLQVLSLRQTTTISDSEKRVTAVPPRRVLSWRDKGWMAV